MTSPPDASEPKQRILIVDDKQENLVALCRVLGDLDAEVVQATNGNDALAATLHNDFALAMLDIQMPGMDGYELAALLRGDEHTQNLPIIFITAAYCDEAQVFRGYEAGAVDYIIKPYQARVLLSKVNIFLELHRANSALARSLAAEAQANAERIALLERELLDMARLAQVTGPATRIAASQFGRRALRERDPALFQEHVSEYRGLLDQAVEKQLYRVALPANRAVQAFAMRLGFLSAGPQDVIEIHTETLKTLTGNSRQGAYVEEGRMLLLELMGRLVACYRSYVHAAKSHE